MKNIGNRIAKRALLEIIYDTIKGTRLSRIELEGYERDKDRVKFVYEGRKCSLYGAYLPNPENDMIVLQVFARKERGDAIRLWDIPIIVRDMKFKTLDRIACELYDYCKGEADKEYEDIRKERIAGYMDNYREFMS